MSKNETILNMNTEKQIEKLAYDLIYEDYSNTTFATRLYDLFCKHDELIAEYIKPGRKFWLYDDEMCCYRKLTVTYTRTGVVFYIFDDEPEIEYAGYVKSIKVMSFYAAQIYPNEIANLLSKYYKAEDFHNICKQCKWDDCNGKITTEVIWE